jgi:hypothetical protein
MSSVANVGFTFVEWTGAFIHNAFDYLISTPSIGQTSTKRRKRRAMKRRVFFRRVRERLGLPKAGDKRLRDERQHGTVADADQGPAKRQRIVYAEAEAAPSDPKIAALEAELAMLREEMAKIVNSGAVPPPPPTELPPPPPSMASSSSSAPPPPPPPPAGLHKQTKPSSTLKSHTAPMLPLQDIVARSSAMRSRIAAAGGRENVTPQRQRSNLADVGRTSSCPQDLIAAALQRKFKSVHVSPPASAQKKRARTAAAVDDDDDDEEDDDDWNDTPRPISALRARPLPSLPQLSLN